jgi:hypothetical protein
VDEEGEIPFILREENQKWRCRSKLPAPLGR